ncbi:hypothetical protein C8Q80DRAFT_1112906 [Daedaleopsis nitida]|nr:hypothetical protein C8Q80DRAFT_1112906 [Daedaleopsis nitida]
MSYYSGSGSYSTRGRGSSYRGRGGGYSSYRPPTHVSLPPDRDLMEGLRPTAVHTLSKPTAGASASAGAAAVKPQNVEYIGSYSWVDEAQPTIIVPGSPREWLERAFPYRVAFDTGVRFVDQNGYRMGARASCLLPLLRAADVVAEENADTSMDWAAVDVVTDRNGLRKLMRWLQHDRTTSEEPLKEFRIDLQLGGRKTVLMHRWEKRTRENAEPPRTGCGFNFERESTRPAAGCERGTGHHRIVRYDFGGLKMVVRFEVDACIPQPRAGGAPTSPTRTQPASPRKSTATSANVDSLTDLLANLGVSSQSNAATSSTESASDITVIRAGSQVPQRALVELTTRSAKYVDAFDWKEQYPQLLLSGTPHLFLAVHDRGMFERIKKHELGTAELRRTVESSPQTQGAFRRLGEALRAIQRLVVEHGPRTRLSLVCRDGALEVFVRTGTEGGLPESELERFGV